MPRVNWVFGVKETDYNFEEKVENTRCTLAKFEGYLSLWVEKDERLRKQGEKETTSDLAQINPKK